MTFRDHADASADLVGWARLRLRRASLSFVTRVKRRVLRPFAGRLLASPLGSYVRVWAGTMRLPRVLEVVEHLQAAGVFVWVAGGWGVDGLVGHQTRRHGDLDLLIDGAHEQRALATPASLGYSKVEPWPSPGPLIPKRIVTYDPFGRAVDVHPVDLATWLSTIVAERLPGGADPAEAAFAEGRLGDRTVPCLSRRCRWPPPTTATSTSRPTTTTLAFWAQDPRGRGDRPARPLVATTPRSHRRAQRRADARPGRRVGVQGMGAAAWRPRHRSGHAWARDAPVSVRRRPAAGRRHRGRTRADPRRAAAFPFVLSAVGRFPGVLCLAPDPAEPFIALTRAIEACWPQHPSYEGAFDDVVPHVTVVKGQEPPAVENGRGGAAPAGLRVGGVADDRGGRRHMADPHPLRPGARGGVGGT